jgi:hypothetical protein
MQAVAAVLCLLRPQSLVAAVVTAHSGQQQVEVEAAEAATSQ